MWWWSRMARSPLCIPVQGLPALNGRSRLVFWLTATTAVRTSSETSVCWPQQRYRHPNAIVSLDLSAWALDFPDLRIRIIGRFKKARSGSRKRSGGIRNMGSCSSSRSLPTLSALHGRWRPEIRKTRTHLWSMLISVSYSHSIRIQPESWTDQGARRLRDQPCSPGNFATSQNDTKQIRICII